MMKIKGIFRIAGVISFLLSLTLICSLNPLRPSPAFASAVQRPVTKLPLVPASLLKWPEKASGYVILVDKSAQQVLVYQRDNLFAPVRVFPCSTGENDGPKIKRNDRRTPQGIYFFTHSYEDSELAPIYGVRAFAIDYPSPLDKMEGKDGYGIWIHGTNKPLKPYDTNGCIALDNEDIKELAAYIQMNDTPVIISSRIEMVEPDALEKERESLEGIIEGWRRTWAEKEINGYMDFYSHRFTSGGKDWDGWRRYKEGLAKTYDQIDVDIDSLLLLKNEGVVLAKFNQLYHTLRFNSYGEKRLYLQRNSDEWKIVGEFFQLAKKLQPEPQKAPPPSTEEIRSFLSSWIKAWEEKDLNGYLSHYDPEFRSRGMDLEAWRVHRERLNRKYRALKIEISDLIIVKISDDTAKVSFKQDYRADGYRDFGLKKILLVKRSDHWKIKQEEWSPLRR